MVVREQATQQRHPLVTVYEFDYFSGSQMGIYIGDILVDDIYMIDFSVTQSRRPIYGYASQYYHTVADGQVFVEGNFAISFKESDYLLATLAHYQEKLGPISFDKKQYRVMRENIERRIKRENQGWNEASKALTSREFRADMSSRIPDGIPESDRYEFYRDLARLSDEHFENIAEIHEDHLWQHPDANYYTPNLHTGDHVEDKTTLTHRRADQYPPFDIWVLYGDITNAKANHTIKRIQDCRIVGQGQSISVGGEPIIEQYQFIARNLA
jgi:hypothetical protein